MSDRKIHFSEPLHKTEYLDKQWETASRLARDGSEWVRIGLDRQRFRDRIERTAEILNEILDIKFRQRIYQERFENFVTTEQDILTNKLEKTTITSSEKDTVVVEPSDNAPQSHLIAQEQQQNQLAIKNNISNRHKQHSRRNKRNSARRRHRGGHRKKKN